VVRFAVPAKKSGTVGTVPTVPGATAVHLTEKSFIVCLITENVLDVCSIKCYKSVTGELPLLYYQEIGIRSLSAPESVYLFISIN
jgi:hypothetical protein